MSISRHARFRQMAKKQIRGIDVRGVPEFLEMIYDSGGHLWARRMSADVMQRSEDNLYERVKGGADFIEISEGAQMIFI